MAIRSEIGESIAENLRLEMEDKLDRVKKASCPQAEVFKIRKQYKKSIPMDFPLKDINGKIRVTRAGVDEVITDHFNKVFQQNGVPDGWENYWECVDKIYDKLSVDEATNVKSGPIFSEISDIIDDLDKNKAVYGSMRIDLVKLGDQNLKRVIYMCVSACFESGSIPDEFRLEKMVLLYKNKGKLDELDNYRGIFLRLLILTIYQKWLYTKTSPIVNENGSDAAFGGRKWRGSIQPCSL